MPCALLKFLRVRNGISAWLATEYPPLQSAHSGCQISCTRTLELDALIMWCHKYDFLGLKLFSKVGNRRCFKADILPAHALTVDITNLSAGQWFSSQAGCFELREHQMVLLNLL